jgi:TldD protein
MTDSLPATDALGIARELILRPGGLDDARLDQVFGQVLRHRVDFADLYFQISREESWALEDGTVKDGSASIEQGVGVRALAGEKTGFAYSDEIVWPALEEASRAARAIALQGDDRAVQAWHAQTGHQLYLPLDPAAALIDEQKVAWLERVDRETRRIDPRIVQVMASMATVHEVVLIATSDGNLAADIRPLVRFNVSVIVEQDGRREQGYAGAGGRFSLADLVAEDRPLALGREAARQALVNLDAVPAPAGPTTVVLGPGWPGVLLHVGVRQPHRRARGNRGLHSGRRWHALAAARLTQH